MQFDDFNKMLGSLNCCLLEQNHANREVGDNQATGAGFVGKFSQVIRVDLTQWCRRPV